jgi:hypothetical protein
MTSDDEARRRPQSRTSWWSSYYLSSDASLVKTKFDGKVARVTLLIGFSYCRKTEALCRWGLAPGIMKKVAGQATGNSDLLELPDTRTFPEEAYGI